MEMHIESIPRIDRLEWVEYLARESENLSNQLAPLLRNLHTAPKKLIPVP
jgi:hypothetical protein